MSSAASTPIPRLDEPATPIEVRRPINKSLLATLRACGLQTAKMLAGEAPDSPRAPLAGAALLGTAVHRALATVFSIWQRGDHVNTEETAIRQLWGRSWSVVAPHTPPNEEGLGLLTCYIGTREGTFVGPRASARILFVERRFRARVEHDGFALTFEATPDVVTTTIGSPANVTAWEHTTRSLPLASADDLACMAMLDQFCLANSPNLPPDVRALKRAMVVDDVVNGQLHDCTISSSAGKALLAGLVADLRAAMTGDPLRLARPAQAVCSGCAWRTSCPAAWRVDEEAQ